MLILDPIQKVDQIWPISILKCVFFSSNSLNSALTNGQKHTQHNFNAT